MKKYYFIKTNGYNIIVSVSEYECRYITENNEFPVLPDDTEEQEEVARNFLETIEDDSSWEDDCTELELFESGDIIAELESLN